jgi:CYTH domain-containing protein
MNIEIERKFLLKAIPDKTPDEVIEIFQWYLKNDDGIWERARSCYSDIKGFYFIHTIKKNISPGVNEEDEKYITPEEFNSFVEKCKMSQSRYISKERLVYKDKSGLKWEVDVFNNGHHLIVAEIEIPSIDFEIELPTFIKDKLLIEVTGLKQFGNRNLSNKYVRKSKAD